MIGRRVTRQVTRESAFGSVSSPSSRRTDVDLSSTEGSTKRQRGNPPASLGRFHGLMATRDGVTQVGRFASDKSNVTLLSSGNVDVSLKKRLRSEVCLQGDDGFLSSLIDGDLLKGMSEVPRSSESFGESFSTADVRHRSSTVDDVGDCNADDLASPFPEKAVVPFMEVNSANVPSPIRSKKKNSHGYISQGLVMFSWEQAVDPSAPGPVSSSQPDDLISYSSSNPNDEVKNGKRRWRPLLPESPTRVSSRIAFLQRKREQEEVYRAGHPEWESEMKLGVAWPVAIVSPSEGEVLVKGEKYEICWEAECCKNAYVALVRIDGREGVEIYPIHFDTGDARSVEWTVPDACAAGRYRIEIASKIDGGAYGIGPPMSVVSSEDEELVEASGRVWCICGAVDSSGDSFYVQCSVCETWQHAACMRVNNAQVGEIVHLCPWCSTDSLGMPPRDEFASKFVQMILKADLSPYPRRFGDLFYSTDLAIGRFISTLINPESTPRIADFGAGTGNLSRFIEPSVFCIESNCDRLREGKVRLPRHDWRRGNVFSNDFIDWMCHGGEDGRFDCIISNPDFEKGLAFLYIALAGLSRINPCAKLIFLLPSDFFEGNKYRSEVYRIMHCQIVKEYRLGHLHYGNYKNAKHTCDSLFVIASGRENKFDHAVHQLRVARGISMRGTDSSASSTAPDANA